MSRMSSSRVYRVELEAYVRESHARRAEDARIVEANRNNVDRYCEVIGHTVKGRVWQVIDERDGLLILSRSLGEGRMDAMFIARPDQVTNLY